MEWRTVGIDVSDQGDVRFEGRELPTRSSKQRYQSVQFSVHRLVALAFLGPRPTDRRYVVDHVDGNPGNNRADNLQWLPHGENTRKAAATRERILDADTIADIARQKPPERETLVQMAERFGVSYAAVRAVRTGRTFCGRAPSNRAILRPEQVAEIRAWTPPGTSAAALARKHHVSQATILNIWRTSEHG